MMGLAKKTFNLRQYNNAVKAKGEKKKYQSRAKAMPKFDDL
jgi:hypothetical protein